MDEPVYEQICEALKALFKTIVADGATYFYTVDDVARVLEWEAVHLDNSKGHFLFLKPGTGTEEEGTTGTIAGLAEFSVLIAKLDERASSNPFEEDKDAGPTAATIVSRCIADVRSALLSDVRMGGLVWNTMHGECTADYSYPIPGWLSAIVTFTVQYDYPKVSA